nr:hypothetical protein [Tanacetum cinerariifolium]
MKNMLSAHQNTISILSKEKEAQIKLYKTREDKELEKVIELENKVKILNNIVYKTGQSVQMMNMLNNKCRTSFAKPEYLKKAKSANPRLYDIGCYNDNLALMLAIESDEVIRPEKEIRSKLSDLIKPFDYTKLNNLYDLFVPQHEKLSEQRLNAKTSNVNFVCVTCGKCVLNDKHDMCVLNSRNDVNSRTKMPMAVPISTREPKRIVNHSVAKPLRRTVASKSTNQKPRHTTRKLYEYVKIILFIVDSGCSKHMTGNLKLLTNFVEKFLGTVKFGNDQIALIIGYGDLVQGAIIIKRVYYVEGLNHNLFSVGQFCDADLEVAFQKSTCYIRDLKGNDLLTGFLGTYLYSITLHDTSSPNPICLMAKATSSQAWLWHRRLSHLNFDAINLLSKNDIVIGLPKLKFVKDHLCSSCELGKAKRKSFQTKTTPSSKRRLHLLHKDLCGPMRVESINGKKYVLVIVDDYSRYTWTNFFRSKDETPKVLIDFLRLVQRGLHAQVRIVQTDKGTKFLNKTLHAYFASEGIIHQMSVARTPEQNGVVKRWNRTLVEAARTMLSATKVPLFFWAEAIATTCVTQNLRDGENLDKMKEKCDACIFVGYSTHSRAYKMASDHVSSDPVPQCQSKALEHDSLSPGPQCQETVPHAAGTTSNTLHYAIIEAGGKDRPPMLAPDKVVSVSKGSLETTTETYMENYKNVLQDIRDQLNAKAKAVQILLTGIDNDIYSIVDACPNACEM